MHDEFSVHITDWENFSKLMEYYKVGAYIGAKGKRYKHSKIVKDLVNLQF